jgi:hypothetical protein
MYDKPSLNSKLSYQLEDVEFNYGPSNGPFNGNSKKGIANNVSKAFQLENITLLIKCFISFTSHNLYNQWDNPYSLVTQEDR